MGSQGWTARGNSQRRAIRWWTASGGQPGAACAIRGGQPKVATRGGQPKAAVRGGQSGGQGGHFNLTTQYVPDLAEAQHRGNLNVRRSKPNIKVDYPNDEKILDALTILILKSYVPESPATIEACRANLASAVGDSEEEDPQHILFKVIFEVDETKKEEWNLINSEIDGVLKVYKILKSNTTPIAGMTRIKITRELTMRGAIPEKNLSRKLKGANERSRGLRGIRVRSEFIETAQAENHTMPSVCIEQLKAVTEERRL